MSDGRYLWRRIRRIWMIAGATAMAVFVTWSLVAYRASPEARESSSSDSVVDVTRVGGVLRFVPKDRPGARHTVFVFFPGALVDPRAYAPLARSTAAAGFPTFIVELPRRGAFGGADAPELWTRFHAVLRELNHSAQVVVGGHSRGGVVASQVASRPFSNFAGLILIGTSHPRDVDLSSLQVPVVKIVGTQDGLATRREVQANIAKLPGGTQWIWVEGGNHSQFAWYGFQPGDWPATLDGSAQRQLTIEAVLATLQEVEARQLTSSSTRGAESHARDGQR